MMRDLASYRSKVADQIERRTGEVILNSSIDEASIIAQEAFLHARNEIRILTYSLSSDGYGKKDLRTAARAFLADPDRRARILIEAGLWDENENYEWEKHTFVSDLLEFAVPGKRKPNLFFRIVPAEWSSRYSFNFMLLDDYGYRFEEDRRHRAAVAAFLPENGPKNAVDSLSRNFETLWDVSRPLQLREKVHAATG